MWAEGGKLAPLSLWGYNEDMQSTPSSNWDESAHLRRVFGLLVLFRWLSLLPPLFVLLSADPTAHTALALAAAALSNAIVTLIPVRLNRLIRQWPPALGVDLAFCAGMLALTGGWRSPYFLFALSPLLAGAFFFRLRGALISAG